MGDKETKKLSGATPTEFFSADADRRIYRSPCSSKILESQFSILYRNADGGIFRYFSGNYPV